MFLVNQGIELSGRHAGLYILYVMYVHLLYVRGHVVYFTCCCCVSIVSRVGSASTFLKDLQGSRGGRLDV